MCRWSVYIIKITEAKYIQDDVINVVFEDDQNFDFSIGETRMLSEDLDLSTVRPTDSGDGLDISYKDEGFAFFDAYSIRLVCDKEFRRQIKK